VLPSGISCPPPFLAQRNDQGAIALHVRGAMELVHAVECGERVAWEPFLTKHMDHLGERGDGDDRSVGTKEAEERRERGPAQAQRHGARLQRSGWGRDGRGHVTRIGSQG
jgi:hypothetical protein